MGVFLYQIDGIEINYSNINDRLLKKIGEYLEIVPNEIKKAVKKIVMVPYKNENIAGMVKDEVIYLYDFESYETSTQKYIIWHEVGHIWENYLRQVKLLDYDLTDYSEAVKCDKNFITDYSKMYTIEKDRYSEDFADSIAEYLANKDKFFKKYSNRAEYIENLIINQRKMELKENFSSFFNTKKEVCKMWNFILGLIMKQTYI